MQCYFTLWWHVHLYKYNNTTHFSYSSCKSNTGSLIIWNTERFFFLTQFTLIALRQEPVAWTSQSSELSGKLHVVRKWWGAVEETTMSSARPAEGKNGQRTSTTNSCKGFRRNLFWCNTKLHSLCLVQSFFESYTVFSLIHCTQGKAPPYSFPYSLLLRQANPYLWPQNHGLCLDPGSTC